MKFDDINKELNRLKLYSPKRFSIYIKTHHSNLYEKILIFKFNNEIDLCPYSEKLKYILNGIDKPNRCGICDKIIHIDKKFCSNSCQVTYQHKSGYHTSSFGKKEVKDKIKLKMVEKYGVDNYFKTEECRIKSASKQSRDKAVDTHRKTCQETYGLDWHSQTKEHRKLASICLHTEEANEQREIVMQEKFGCDNYMLTSEFKTIREEKRQENKEKEYKTRKKNNTFNTSKPEQLIKEKLLCKFPDTIYQYKDKNIYPFACDFYIPSLSLFIEYQGHWTHGGKPYQSTTDDLNKIKKWREKETVFYKVAEEVWTQKDVIKRNMAENNNLNWIEFFTLEEFENWYNKI